MLGSLCAFRKMRREPNIIRIVCALYHRKPIKIRAHTNLFLFIIISSLRSNGWVACANNASKLQNFLVKALLTSLSID